MSYLRKVGVPRIVHFILTKEEQNPGLETVLFNIDLLYFKVTQSIRFKIVLRFIRYWIR